MSLNWQLRYEARALKQLKKLDPRQAKRIVETLRDNLDKYQEPRAFGDAMVGDWTGYWRYRVGDFRAICKIEDDVVTVFVIEVGHRSDVYR